MRNRGISIFRVGTVDNSEIFQAGWVRYRFICTPNEIYSRITDESR